MKTIRAVFCSLVMLMSIVIYAQDMTMDAKEFNNRKEVSDERIRSDYRDATGKQFATIKSENSTSILAVTYDVGAEKGKAALLVKYQDEVIWKKEISSREQANIEVELPKEGEYLLIIDLKNASGQHDIRWKLKPSPTRE